MSVSPTAPQTLCSCVPMCVVWCDPFCLCVHLCMCVLVRAYVCVHWCIPILYAYECIHLYMFVIVSVSTGVTQSLCACMRMHMCIYASASVYPGVKPPSEGELVKPCLKVKLLPTEWILRSICCTVLFLVKSCA